MKNYLLLSAVTLVMISCGGPKEGELVKESTAKFMHEEFDTKTDNNEKRIAIEGYIYTNGSLSVDEKNKMSMGLYTEPFGEGDNLLSFDTELGDGKNEVNIPMHNGKSAGYKTEEFTFDDKEIRFTTNDGTQYDLSQKVKLSGTATYILTMPPVELRDALADTTYKKYAWDLKDVRIDLVK